MAQDVSIPIKVTSEFVWYGELIASRLRGSGAQMLAEAGGQIAQIASDLTYQIYERHTGFAGSSWGYILEGYGKDASVRVGSFGNPPDVVTKHGAHRQPNYVTWLNEGWHDRAGKWHNGGKMLQKARDQVAPAMPGMWKQAWEGWGFDDFGRGIGRVTPIHLTGQAAYVSGGGGIPIGNLGGS